MKNGELGITENEFKILGKYAVWRPFLIKNFSKHENLNSIPAMSCSGCGTCSSCSQGCSGCGIEGVTSQSYSDIDGNLKKNSMSCSACEGCGGGCYGCGGCSS